MCEYMCVLVCACVCVRVCVFAGVCVCKGVRVYLHVCMYVCVVVTVTRPDSGSKYRGFIKEAGSPGTGRGRYTGRQGIRGHPKTWSDDRQMV